MKTRVYFLDNLRTFLILLVVLLHSGLVYEHVLENSWIVVDPVKSNGIGLIRMYLDLFVMFSIFFISGYFVPWSLKNKTSCQFVRSKLKRIMLPWGIAVLTLIPAYKAIFLYARGLPQEEWYSYFHFFERAGTDWSFFANCPTQNWLWFLPVLFAFQLLYLVFYKLNLLSFRIGLKTGVLVTFFVGVGSALLVSFSGHSGWTHSFLFDFQNERLLIYFSVFLLGSLCNKLRVFDNGKRNTKQYILVNALLTIVLGIFTAVALNLFFNLITPERNYFFISETVDRIIYHSSAVLSMLCFLYVLIDVFRFQLNKTSRLLAQLSESSYEVYVIHVVVLGVLALILIPLSIPSWLKFILLTASSYALSNYLVYTWQKGFQKHFRLKTIPAYGLTILVIFWAFSGQPAVSSVNPVSASVQEYTTVQSIHAAVISGNLEAVRQLVESGTDVDKTEPEGGSSPLIVAALFNKPGIADYLIENGADLNFKNNEGSTALHSAAFFGRAEIVSKLLRHGADTGIRNNAGSTALETVLVPFETVKGIYEYFVKVYSPLGLDLDLEKIEANRPKIAKLLQP